MNYYKKPIFIAVAGFAAIYRLELFAIEEADSVKFIPARMIRSGGCSLEGIFNLNRDGKGLIVFASQKNFLSHEVTKRMKEHKPA